MKKIFAASGITLAVGLIGGGVYVNTAFGKAKIQQELNETYPLSSNGVVSIDNVNGKVRVVAWDRCEVRLHAVKHGADQADLDAVKIEIVSKADEVRIHTKYPNLKWRWRSNSAEVDYELNVPSRARVQSAQNVNGAIELENLLGPVEASTVNGRLRAEGLGGQTSLETVNGMIDASFRTLEGVNAVSLKTVNGKVKLQLPSDANAEVAAKTLNGSIQGGPNLSAKKQWPVGVDLKGKLGKGGARISAETVNGAIQISQSTSVSAVPLEDEK